MSLLFHVKQNLQGWYETPQYKLMMLACTIFLFNILYIFKIDDMFSFLYKIIKVISTVQWLSSMKLTVFLKNKYSLMKFLKIRNYGLSIY